MTDIDAYLSFVLKLFLAFGLAFEIPVATMLLIKAGIASPESLKEKRPYVFIGCFVVGMLVTPPDMISQTLLAVPMWLLFEAGLIGARFLGSKKTEDVDGGESAPTDSQAVALIDNEASDQDNDSSDDIDEFDLYAPVKADDDDSPIIEELDKPEPLDTDGTDVGPPKPSQS
jgi:sec-independent protein translocase protein TatC